MKGPQLAPTAEHAAPDAHVLLIDNYDSFTYNIRELLAKIGVDVTVVRNDHITAREIEEMNPSHIIISPGPGTPEKPEDIGVTSAAIEYAVKKGRALLGVCLGHQALGHHFGAKIIQAEEIKHGKTSQLDISPMPEHSAYPSIMEGVDPGKDVMRYHSLAVDPQTFPKEFSVTARTRDKFATIMAMQHNELPIAGVQFHPESFATPEGRKMMENFLRFDPVALAKLKNEGVSVPKHNEHLPPLDARLGDHIGAIQMRNFEAHEFPCDLPPEEVYARLHDASDRSFCFESLGAEEGDKHYSYFGMAPLFELSARNEEFFLNDQKMDTNGANAYDALTSATEEIRTRGRNGAGTVPKGYKFAGGLVGGITYEALQYAEPTVLPPEGRTPEGRKTFSFSYYPDGLIYNAQKKQYTYFTRGEDRRGLFMAALSKPSEETPPVIEQVSDGMSREDYMRHVQEIRDEAIRTGESFQVVLSRAKKFRLKKGSMVELYKRMREFAPSQNMHAVNMGGGSETIGSFPELILKIGKKGKARTYQVAGTRRRTGNPVDDQAIYDDLRADPKEVAEHFMLVDLARNDLARASIPGTVEIENLAEKLSAGGVLHMATKVKSRMNGIPHLVALEYVSPMGTVSGAPKVESMKIIYEHEDGEQRGHYAGALGFLSLHGPSEFVVELRNIARQDDIITVRAGAGIVYDSDPEKEFEETEQKMRPGLNSILPYVAV